MSEDNYKMVTEALIAKIANNQQNAKKELDSLRKEYSQLVSSSNTVLSSKVEEKKENFDKRINSLANSINQHLIKYSEENTSTLEELKIKITGKVQHNI